MKNERIYINEDTWFDTYIHDKSNELHPNKKRPAVIVCPGGGYSYTSDREAEPMAIAYAGMGYHTFVLRYSNTVESSAMPRPLKELAQTVIYIKKHAEEWQLDAEHVFLTGFSAGGHLAASLGVFWNNKEMLPEFDEDRELLRPAGLILGYPVIDLKSTCTALDIGIQGYPDYDKIEFGLHPNIKPEDAFVRKDNKTYINFEVTMNAYIFNGYATDEGIYQYSLQNHVNVDTPPAFIWHGGEDGLIFPRNSMLFANALMEHNIPVELHIFGKGGHGLGLANEVTSNNFWEDVPQCRPWITMACEWIKSILHPQ